MQLLVCFLLAFALYIVFLPNVVAHKVGYIIRFGAIEPFQPVTAKQLLDGSLGSRVPKHGRVHGRCDEIRFLEIVCQKQAT